MDVDPSILGSLRCFEAAGRLLNFTRAAEALHLTQSAVSQQIRLLEDRLGFALFVRQSRGLKLTPKGGVLLESVRTALAEISMTVDRLAAVSTPLQVNCLPSLALHWLVPRLDGFYRHQPDVSVRLTAELRSLDLTTMKDEGIDLSIRYEAADQVPPQSETLLREYLFPVATPEYLAKHPAFGARESCDGITFLHDASPWIGAPEYFEWQLWLAARRPEWLANLAGPQFNFASLMISAALNHQGVALGRTAIVFDELKSGRLVDVFKAYVPAPASYILLQLNSKRSHSAAFRNWISSESKHFNLDRKLLLPTL